MSLRSGRQENKRIYNWSLKLCDYDFDMEYRAGKLNIVADNLSRCYGGSEDREEETALKVGGDVGRQ